MKTQLRILVTLLTAFLLFSANTKAQNVFSRFDFFDFPLETATIGPNGLSVDGDATTDGGAFVQANCGGVKGIDLEIPNPGNLFDKSSLGMGFGFRKVESRSDFFVRGGTSFYQTGGQLYIQFRTSNGAGGFVDYGPINTGFVLPADLLYHEYIFVYQEALGTAYISVDGVNVWTFDGPDNRPLYWTGAPNAMVGTVMDGNCPGFGVLDYAYFFDPIVPLDAQVLTFEGRALDESAVLSWELETEHDATLFSVERSLDGKNFEQIGEVQAQENTSQYSFTDVQPGAATWFYRLETIDAQGNKSLSETVEVTLGESMGIKAWPNPCRDEIQLQLPAAAIGNEVLVHNAQGRLVLKQMADQTTMTLDLQTMAPGIYFLQVQTENELQRKRIVIQ